MQVGLYIPCFNSEQTIQPCLDAVFKQEYQLKEVLVVDDGSCDKTTQIASKYPVKIIRHKTNKGLAAARNTALRNIKTEFVASLDADCIPDPDWLLRLINQFNSPKVAGIGGKLLEENVSTVFDYWRSVHMKQSWGEKAIASTFLFGSNTVFRKEALAKVGYYDKEFQSNYEDVDISKRLKKKGWILIYEPKAIARHIKRDNIYSVFNSYWQWNLCYYQKKRFYLNLEKFIFKIKDNIGLANRYLEEDLASGRHQLIYLDLLLALHHSLKDFEYFTYRGHKQHLSYAPISYWVSLVDLTFFYHLEPSSVDMATLAPKTNALLQNLFALNLILGKFIDEGFKDSRFKETLSRHLLASLYKIDDAYLLEKLLNLIEFHDDWSGLSTKQQPNLNTLFLKEISLAFQAWLKDLIYRFPGIIEILRDSAEGVKIDNIVFKEEAYSYETK
mgnify:CR=1 FL=1